MASNIIHHIQQRKHGDAIFVPLTIVIGSIIFLFFCQTDLLIIISRYGLHLHLNWSATSPGITYYSLRIELSSGC